MSIQFNPQAGFNSFKVAMDALAGVGFSPDIIRMRGSDGVVAELHVKTWQDDRGQSGYDDNGTLVIRGKSYTGKSSSWAQIAYAQWANRPSADGDNRRWCPESLEIINAPNYMQTAVDVAIATHADASAELLVNSYIEMKQHQAETEAYLDKVLPYPPK